jgi:hypothetical protein
MKSNTLDTIPESVEIERGEKLVALLHLKEAKQCRVTGKPGSGYESYNPPRYHTEWGTKTALGVFRSIAAIVHGID